MRTLTPSGAAPGLRPGAEIVSSQPTNVATVVGAGPDWVTVTVGAVPRPEVKSKPVMVIVTTCGTPPGAPAGLGVAVTTVNVGAVRSSTTVALTALWLPYGGTGVWPAQHQLPNASR